MTTTTSASRPSRLRRAWALLAAGTLTASLLAAGAATTPAAAESQEPWIPLKDKSSYLMPINRVVPVLHVDTAHEDANGFWFATQGARDGTGRGFVWNYQRYGVQCYSASYHLAFNPWLNTYTCMFDAPAAQRNRPAGDQIRATEQCRAETNRPWMMGTIDTEGTRRCESDGIKRTRFAWKALGSQGTHCAPWEPQGPKADGTAKCDDVTYPWVRNPEPLPWTPEPDTCTGLPRHWNAYGGPSSEISTAAQSAPGCDGSEPTPNCTPAVSWHAACGGQRELGAPVGPWTVENSGTGPGQGGSTGGGDGGGEETPTSYTTNAEVTVTGEGYTATATEGATGRASVVRGRAKGTYTKRAHGRRYSATRYRNITITKSAFRTRSVTVTYNPITVPATAVCTAPTLEEAQECAREKARAAGFERATAMARSEAEGAASSYARIEAERAAAAAARAAAQEAAVTSTVRSRFASLAKADAKAAVMRAIRADRRS